MEDALQNAEPSLQLQVQEWLDLGEDFDTVVLTAANAIVKPGMPLTSKSNLGLYSVAAQFCYCLKTWMVVLCLSSTIRWCLRVEKVRCKLWSVYRG